MGIAVGALWLSSLLADHYPSIPTVFLLTTPSLLQAQLPAAKQLTVGLITKLGALKRLTRLKRELPKLECSILHLAHLVFLATRPAPLTRT